MSEIINFDERDATLGEQLEDNIISLKGALVGHMLAKSQHSEGVCLVNMPDEIMTEFKDMLYNKIESIFDHIQNICDEAVEDHAKFTTCDDSCPKADMCPERKAS